MREKPIKILSSSYLASTIARDLKSHEAISDTVDKAFVSPGAKEHIPSMTAHRKPCTKYSEFTSYNQRNYQFLETTETNNPMKRFTDFESQSLKRYGKYF
jgi:hypothetical protein